MRGRDIFAFGCVLYELLTGHAPFEGQTSSSVMAAVLATKPRPIEELLPLTPPALERIVSRCLAKDPEDRWQTRARHRRRTAMGRAGRIARSACRPMVSGRRRVRESVAWGAFALATLARDRLRGGVDASRAGAGGAGALPADHAGERAECEPAGGVARWTQHRVCRTTATASA